MNKRNILIYGGLVALDFVGFVTYFFATITHGLLFFIISIDLYSFIVKYYEDKNKPLLYGIKVFLALAITFAGSFACIFSYLFVFRGVHF
jgi:hypothetical protein